MAEQARQRTTTTPPDPWFNVVEGGPVALWEHVERAHQVWLDHDQPDWPRLGLTVTPQGQHLWIDTPDATSWPLPTTGSESR